MCTSSFATAFHWARSRSAKRRGTGLLFAGRFSPEKGAAEAIEIAKAAGLPITLVGDAYDERYMAEHIEPHRGDPDIRIVDALVRRDLWRLMSRCAAVLCPAQWDEPFGLVAAEAQAAGTPVVAFASWCGCPR